MKSRIIVLNFNGCDLLERYLPSVVKAAGFTSPSSHVTVLDNGSVDGSERFVAEQYPDVDYVKTKSNRVFCSYNDYLRQLDEEVVILLNNDIRVKEHFADPLLEVFKDHKDAFFASPKTLNESTGVYEGCRSRLEMRHGLLWGTAIFKGFEKGIEKFGLSMQTGFGAFHRERFLALGGFDDLYLPGTVEDSDLCFRAYRRGWKGYYCPNSVVFHCGQATFKRTFGESGIRRLNRRNLYLFVWKNIQSPAIFVQHLIWIPVQLLKHVVFGEWDFLIGFKNALFLLPEALKRRRTAGNESHLSDHEVFAISKGLET
jgi:N-acetylglucosaminyl-diphospho-decaprenol L-rhamnosyltransferase